MANLPDSGVAQKNITLGISTLGLWLNFSRALISTRLACFWMDTPSFKDQHCAERVKLSTSRSDSLNGTDKQRPPRNGNFRTNIAFLDGLGATTSRSDCLFFLKFLVFLTKPLDAAGRVDQLLLAGKKRMALRANFHADVLFSRTDFDAVAAGTFDGR
jgi:hypothetical protein